MRGIDADAFLIKAVSKGNLELVRAAIKEGANVNCMLRNDVLSDLLLGPLLSFVKEVDLTVLCLAVKNGDVAITRQLIKSGANVNLECSESGVCPIHVAARKGDIRVFRVLIKCGADVNLRDRNGNAPIHYASAAMNLWGLVLSGTAEHVEVLKELVAGGADINAKDCKGRTAILLAASSFLSSDKKHKFILELINLGAEVGGDESALRQLHMTNRTRYILVTIEMMQRWNKLCDSDKTVLASHLTVLIPNEDSLLWLFDEKPYQGVLNIPDDSGRTILQNIVSLGQSETLKTLLSYGVSVAAIDALGQTLLHSAMPIGNEEIIRGLLKADCDHKVRDNFGRSVLHLGAFYGHCKLIELFLSKGLDPNDVDYNGRNSLHYAVMNRQDDAVRSLCYAGADKEQKDLKGLAPRDFLHPCENTCLTTLQLHGEVILPVLTFEEDKEFHPGIMNTPKLDTISKIPGTGAANHIKDFNMNHFVKTIKDVIVNVVSRALPTQKRETTEVVTCGSLAEDSKVGIPNEVDFLIIVADASSLPYEYEEGYSLMDRLWRDDSVLHAPGSYSVWLWDLLMKEWNYLQKEHTNHESNFHMPFPPVRRPDQTTCVNWVWLYSDDVFKMLPVSIDLVITFRNKEAAIRVTTWLKSIDERIDAYIVPKIPEEDYRKKIKFIPVEDFDSHPPLEVEHLVSLEDRVKVVYITAKCLRMPELCCFKIQANNGKLCIVSDYVTSYHLKTVFLHLAEMFMKSNLSLGRMVLMVYEQLELCLERKRLPMFFDEKLNVLAGSRLKISESLKVSRVMTKFVRMLYERDYASDVDQDAEEEMRVRNLIPECLSTDARSDTDSSV